jgi:hypothetical protein
VGIVDHNHPRSPGVFTDTQVSQAEHLGAAPAVHGSRNEMRQGAELNAGGRFAPGRHVDRDPGLARLRCPFVEEGRLSDPGGTDDHRTTDPSIIECPVQGFQFDLTGYE